MMFCNSENKDPDGVLKLNVPQVFNKGTDWATYKLSVKILKALTYFGKEPDIIVQPYSVSQDTWLKQHSTDWLLAQLGFEGTLDSHYPQDRLIKVLKLNVPQVSNKGTDWATYKLSVKILKASCTDWKTFSTAVNSASWAERPGVSTITCWLLIRYPARPLEEPSVKINRALFNCTC